MLYLITNRHLIKDISYLKVIEESLHAGLDAVIFREKDLTAKEALPSAVELKKMTAQSGAKLIINTHLDVALEIGADFFHIGLQQLHPYQTRLGQCGLPFGLSIHHGEEALYAESLGASYLLASHIFPTDCKKDLAPKGLKLIRDIRSKTKLPLIGLGGITPDNGSKIIESGADGIAVMSSIMASPDPYKATNELKKALR